MGDITLQLLALLMAALVRRRPLSPPQIPRTRGATSVNLAHIQMSSSTAAHACPRQRRGLGPSGPERTLTELADGTEARKGGANSETRETDLSDGGLNWSADSGMHATYVDNTVLSELVQETLGDLFAV